MCDINSEYGKHVIYDKGVKVLYLQVLLTLYGCIESALQWYTLYTKTLNDEG